MTVSDASYVAQHPPLDHKRDCAISSEKSEDGMSSRPSRRTVWDKANGNRQEIKREQKLGFQRCWEFNSYVYSACVQRRHPSRAQGVQQADAQFAHSTRRKKSCLCKICIALLNKSTLQSLWCPECQNSLDIHHCLQIIHLHTVHTRNVFTK